jgi:hypothetical protein
MPTNENNWTSLKGFFCFAAVAAAAAKAAEEEGS